MWLSTTQRQVLIGFLSTEKGGSIAEIANALGMSTGTVRRQLPSIGSWLTKHGSSLERQPDGKLHIQSGTRDKRYLLELLSTEECPPSSLGRQERVDLLTFLIHVSPQPRIVQDFQNQLQVSRSTILEDLTAIAEWYESRQLFLIRRTNYGIKLMGKENDWRKVLIEIILYHYDEPALFRFGSDARFSSHPLSLINPPLAKLITEYLGTLKLQNARELIRLAEARLRTRFVDSDHIILTLHVALLIRRVAEQNLVELDTAQIQSLAGQPAYRVAYEVARLIQEKWGIIVPQSEVAHLTIHLLGAKMDKPSLGELPPEAEQLSQLVLKRATALLKRPLDQDRELTIRLASHLAPTIQRLMRDLPIRNPLLEDIRSRYAEVYAIAQEACGAISEYIGKAVPQDEVAYITMYLAGALMNYEDLPPVRALIVCPSGSATSWLLNSRLKKEFSNIQVLNIYSTRDLQRGVPQNVEIIISTVPLQHNSMPVVVVNALLPEEDVSRIRKSMEALAR
jgi:transcriptional antiterminator